MREPGVLAPQERPISLPRRLASPAAVCQVLEQSSQTGSRRTGRLLFDTPACGRPTPPQSLPNCRCRMAIRLPRQPDQQFRRSLEPDASLLYHCAPCSATDRRWPPPHLPEVTQLAAKGNNTRLCRAYGGPESGLFVCMAAVPLITPPGANRALHPARQTTRKQVRLSPPAWPRQKVRSLIYPSKPEE